MFAIIGAGLMGKRRAESLRELGQELLWVADVKEDLARELAQTYGAQHTTEYHEVLRHPRVEVVIVAVPNAFLADIAADAIRAGKHVLVEKPVAVTRSRIEELARLQEEHCVIVKAGFNHRFLPHVQKARDVLPEIGEIMFVKATYGQKGRIGFEKEWRASRRIAGGGELIDQGVHVIDLCRLFLGEPREVLGVTGTLFWKVDVEDNAFFTARHERGVAHCHVSSCLWRNMFSIEIQGSTGRIELEGLRGHYGKPVLRILSRNEEKSGEVGVYQFDEQEFTFPDEDVTWNEEMKHLLRVLEGKEELSGTLQDAAAAVAVVEDIYEKSSLH